MIIACDFDGVIHNDKLPVKGKRMGEPMLGAVQAIEDLQEQGHTIIIHTVRGNSPKHIEDWCTFYGIEPDGITNIKPNADYYIDNKALTFSSWGQVLGIIGIDEED